MKLSADQDKCIGAGRCVLVAPELFDQRDDDGVVEILQEQPPPAQLEIARNAVALCPAAALFAEDA
ncbi:ferredoxin [Kineosporia babensis]|uniref:Ferredoxin n=1 Tax=Kineosporia babensis TaxID=499548 RepID=A0A9X1T2B4_9ACTN|nr:ferredoxin [Kineosporia babensis]MCD5314458.1 ferredoxin [Kineosporia babensis]